MSANDNPADHWAQTIVGLPLGTLPLRTMSLERQEHTDTNNIALDQQQFKIRLANSDGRRESASLLIKKMYAWRGYETAGATGDTPNRITLMADLEGHVISTLTIGLDSPAGLLVDTLYKDEIDRLRQDQHRVCEFTKLAVDQEIKSKRVLASLFHLAYIYAHLIHGATDTVIEVNPRHAVFYKRMLGFEQLGEERMCPRVNAPAVLLHLPFEIATREIASYGGTFAEIPGVKSIYPFFFSPQDESGMVARLMRNN
jgi:hypothetical protein